MNRQSRSIISRRSSILKIDANREDETTMFGVRNKRTSRRVSFAESYQVKEFPRDSPRIFKDSSLLSDQENDEDNTESTSSNPGLTGLDKLLTGAIQTPYQNVAGYPMPEMSSKSLTLFDINTTILDDVDMETSVVDEDFEDLYPEMDFQSEPSREIKFDASSLLQSLKSQSSEGAIFPEMDFQSEPSRELKFDPSSLLQSLKSQSSEGLKEVQIYSPSRDPNKTKQEQSLAANPSFMFHNFSHHDKENICVPTGVVNPTSNAKQAEMTRYFDSKDVTMGTEETNCIGGIAAQVRGQSKDKENSPVLNLQTKINHPDKRNIIGVFKKDTADYSTNSESVLNTKAFIQRLKPQYDKEDSDNDDMEEATCIIDTIKQDKPCKLTIVSTSSTNKQAEVTKYFNSEDITMGMEETKCVGGIATQVSEESKDKENSTVLCLQAKINPDLKWNKNEVTKYFDSEDIIEGIEETKCVGGIVDQGRIATGNMVNPLNAGNWMVSMNESKNVSDNMSNKCFNQEADAGNEIEETKCTRGMRSSGQPVSSFGLHQEVNTVANKIGVISENLTVTVPFNMEETECYTNNIKVGGGDLSVIRNKLAASTDQTEDIEMTKNISVPMEETKSLGIILDKTRMKSKEMGTIKDQNKTVMDVSDMEETRVVGGMLNQAIKSSLKNVLSKTLSNATIDYTVAMEETKAVGKILERTVNANKTVDYTVAMEETKAVGKILEKTVNANKTVDYTVAMEETKPVGKILEKTVSANKTASKTVDFTVAMEETQSLGKILEKTANANKTVDYTVAMEETQSLGKILEKTANANKTVDYTVAMEETQSLGKILEKTANANKTVDYTVAMEETQSLGKILEKTANANRTVDYTVAMEETQSFGKILEKTANANTTVDYMVAMEETQSLGKILEKTANSNKTANKTVDFTVAMEETKPVGKILEKNVNDITAKGFYTTSSINKTIQLVVPMEETISLGGIINKTTDKTMYFDDVPTDWSAKNLQLKAKGKAADGTVVDNANITSRIEETKCVGGILSEDIEQKTEIEVKGSGVKLINEDQTIAETVEMEETKCETVSVEVGNSLQVSKDSKPRQLNAISDRTTLKPVDIEETVAQRSLESPNSVTAGEKANIKDSDVNREAVSDEITFKISTKRNFDDHKNYGTPEIGEEKTRDLTRTETYLARLREVMIQSSRKTAKHLRSGDIKTPSKAAISASFLESFSRSPLHKRLKMSTERPMHEGVKISGDILTTDLECMTMDCTDLSGIEDEQMPETMHIDLCATGSSNETHSDKNSTVSTESERTTNLEANETSNSGNETQCSGVNVSLESNDTRGSGSDSRSSGYNVSMFSNKSFAVSSFVAPKGPLKLDSFFKLTFNLVSKVKGTRCSTIFAKNIDMDDPVEVLQAELTLPYIVKAKRDFQKRIAEETNRCDAEMEWVEKMLEETQPEIFQQCATASDVELEVITSHLRSLLSACHKEVEIMWKQETKNMFSQMLSDIQEHGIKEAENRLRKARADNKTLDDLSVSLDNELEELERKQQELENLQKQEEKLHRESEEVSKLLRSKQVEEEQLRKELDQRTQSHDIEKERISLIKQIEAHLVCVEWNLEDWREDYVVFTFLDDLLELKIQFEAGPAERHLSNIAWKIRKDCKYFEEKVAVAFVQQGIDTDKLMQKYQTKSSLQKFLHEVSCCVNEIKRFCVDVEKVYKQNVLIVKDNSISLELWDRQSLDLIVVTFTFDPSHPLTNQAQSSVVVRIGSLKSRQIEETLCAVTPGPDYLSRLIQSINFKQLHKDMTT